MIDAASVWTVPNDSIYYVYELSSECDIAENILLKQ